MRLQHKGVDMSEVKRIEVQTKRPVNFLVTEKAYEQIEELRAKRGSTTNSELFRDALKILATLQKFKEEDGTVIIEHNGKKYKLFV